MAIAQVKPACKDAAAVLERVFKEPAVVGPGLAKYLKEEDENATIKKFSANRKRKFLPDMIMLACTLTVPFARAGYNKMKKVSDKFGKGFMPCWNNMNRYRSVQQLKCTWNLSLS